MSRFRAELAQVVRPMATAALGRQGVSKHVVAGPSWQQTTRGFHRPAQPGTTTATQRIVDAAALLPPDAVIGGWAAAYAAGVDQLDGLDDHTLRPLPIPVLLPPKLHRDHVPGVRYVQQKRSHHDVVEVAGIRFSRPLDAALDLGRWARDLTETVVVLDAIRQAGVVAPERIALAAQHLHGARGVRQLRAAIELSTDNAASTWESRLRMFWVLELGFPPPAVNPTLCSASGTFLGIPDLLDEEAGLVLEYDGARWRSESTPGGHRDRDQHREDNAREERFERTGLIVVRVEKADLTRFRARLGRRLRSARVDGLSRNRSRDRWIVVSPAARPPPRSTFHR